MNLRSGKHVNRVLKRETAKRKADRVSQAAAESSYEEQQLLMKVVVAMAVIFIGLVLYAEWNNLWFGRTDAQEVQTLALIPTISSSHEPTSDTNTPRPFHVTLPSHGDMAENYARIMAAMLEHHPQSARPFAVAMGPDLLKEVAQKLVQKDARLLELLSEAMRLPPDREGQCSFRITSHPDELEVTCEGGTSTDTENHEEL